MRAAWRHALPALSRHYGIHPWDVERLTMSELQTYADALRPATSDDTAQPGHNEFWGG